MSMQHALEVRVPFIDHKVLEFCATIPPEMKLRGFDKKRLLKKMMRHVLPSEVVDHRQAGFRWADGPMAENRSQKLRAENALTRKPRQAWLPQFQYGQPYPG